MRARALAALLALAPASALARGGAPAPAEQQLKAAQKALDAGRFRDALSALDRAAPATDPKVQARLHLLRAQCLIAIRDVDGAREAFARALEQDPDAKLDPDKVAPRTVLILESVRDKLQGSLALRADREGATARLDGKPLGPLPLDASVPIGTHTLEALAADGSVGHSETVVVHPHQRLELSWSLPAPAAPAPAPAPAPAAEPARVEAPPPAPEEPGPLRLFGEARLLSDPLSRFGLGYEVGAGGGGRYWVASVDLDVGSALGVTPRGGLRLHRLAGPLGLELTADLPVFFGGGATVGLGASAGPVLSLPHAEVALQVAGRHFLNAPEPYRADYVLLGLGVRAGL